MSRAAVLHRIESLTDDEFAHVEPYLEADLDAADDRAAMRREIDLGLESARTEPLIDNDEVFAMARRRSARL